MNAENTSLFRIITRAIAQARQDGLDQLGQMERAVRSVLAVEPDLTDSAARRLVVELTA
ncbi:MAG TPA: hypothetical protein VK196_20010 [Magnetospirillum sp.]|nr:hypothetical protein [Magnetospirillum sp.]